MKQLLHIPSGVLVKWIKDGSFKLSLEEYQDIYERSMEEIFDMFINGRYIELMYTRLGLTSSDAYTLTQDQFEIVEIFDDGTYK